MTSLRFAKAHAYGNDFLYVEEKLVDGVDLPQLARDMCERHSGIGADGLIVFRRSDAAIAMRLLNADGSRAEVSGNGVRALAALALQHDPRLQATLTINTEAGPREVVRLDRDGTRQVFRTAMGSPAGLRRASIDVAGETLSVVVLNMGNPQCVVLGPLPDPARFQRLGSALERHQEFPDGTNVEFVNVESPERIRISIWERGVGPTQSSGTGSCAALVAAAAFGGANRDAEVIAPGGAQRVDWRNDSVYLTGWAEVLCEGDWLGQIPRTR
jgi:diaminopimelate epimerase